MTSISNRGRTAPRPATAPATTAPATTGASTATPTNATSAAPPAAATSAPIPSAAGSVNTVPKASINGLKGMTSRFDNMATNRFGVDTTFRAGDGSGAVARGYIEVNAAAIPGGARVTVDTFHKDKNDKMTLVLMAEVLDTKTNQLRTINLSVLANQEPMNGKKFRGQRTYDVSYADINKFLAKTNKNLKVNPGHTSLSVMALWNNDDGSVKHRAGGPARGGSFRTPLPDGAASPTSTRIGAMTGAAAEQTDLPLDMQVSYVPALREAYPMLKDGGNIVSRLESEFKGASSKADMTAAVKEMYRLVNAGGHGQNAEVEKLLGKDWSITTVNRYWLKDDGTNTEGTAGTGDFKGFRVGDDGLPLQDPMRDTYMDNKNLSMTRKEGAIRLRSNKQATFINVKPGGGRLDEKTGIRQRIEVGLELEADATTQDATTFLKGVSSNGKWANTVFNHAEREVKKLDSTLRLGDALDPFMDIEQSRHKFTIHNEKTGVEVEFSFDFIKATTLRPEHAGPDGEPRVSEFFVLEGELDHLQLQSENQNSFQASGATAGSFATDDAQTEWLKSTSENVTMDVDPRLHELNDLNNKSFRETASYQGFEKVNGKLIGHLFKNGLGPGKQKAAFAADLLDMNPDTTAGATARVKANFQSFGLDWTPAIEKMVSKKLNRESVRTRINKGIDAGTALKDPIALLDDVYGSTEMPKFKYDGAEIKKQVGRELAKVGLTSNPAVDALLEKITIKKMPPAEFKAWLERLDGADEHDVFDSLAQTVGAKVAYPTVDIVQIKDIVNLDNALATSWISVHRYDDVERFIERAVDKGLSGMQLRNGLSGLSYNPERTLKSMVSGLSGIRVPALEINNKRLFEESKTVLDMNHVAMTPELKTFLTDVARHGSPDDAQSFVRSLSRSDFPKLIADKAKELKITVPAITLDRAAALDVLKTTAHGGGVSFNADLKAFIDGAFDAGATFSGVRSFIDSLGRQTPESALKRATSSWNKSLPDGLSAPKVSYLKAGARQAFDTRMQATPLRDADAMFDFAWALSKATGQPPQALIENIMEIRAENNLGALLKNGNIDVPDGLAVPRRPYFSAKGVMAYLEGQDQLSGKLDAKMTAYLEKALKKALVHDDFDLGSLAWSNVGALMKTMEKLSGLKPPS